MWRSEPQTPRRLDPDDRLVGRAELGIGLLVDPDLAGRLEGDGAHRRRTLRQSIDDQRRVSRAEQDAGPGQRLIARSER